MAENFFEIQNGNFTASEKNKVNNVNLTIKDQGEIISLLGPSGIGKTTILRTIAGLQKLSTGKIFLKNKISGFLDFYLLRKSVDEALINGNTRAVEVIQQLGPRIKRA